MKLLLFASVLFFCAPYANCDNHEEAAAEEKTAGSGGERFFPGPMGGGRPHFATTRRLERIEDILERMYTLLYTRCGLGPVGGIPPPFPYPTGQFPPGGNIPYPTNPVGAGQYPGVAPGPYPGVAHGPYPGVAHGPYPGVGPYPNPHRPGWVRGVGEDSKTDDTEEDFN